MFKKKRVIRKVGQDNEDSATGANDQSTSKTGAAAPKKFTSKPFKASSLRAPDQDAGADGADDDQPAPVVFKRPSKRTTRPPPSSDRLKTLSRDQRIPHRPSSSNHRRRHSDDEDDEEDGAASRPSYTADYLAELKNAQSTAPAAFDASVDDDGIIFGEDDDQSAAPPTNETSAATQTASSTAIVDPYNPGASASYIPSHAEIEEKKERRRRAIQGEASAEDFIPLDDDAGLGDADAEDIPHYMRSQPRRSRDSGTDSDPDSRQKSSLIYRADIRSRETEKGGKRLEREDEDIAEGWESFVDDPGLVTLRPARAAEQEKQRRREIEQQIRRAQRGDLSSDEESEEEVKQDPRIRAYEAAQTRKGAYGVGSSKLREQEREEERKRKLMAVPKLVPVPTMAEMAQRVKNQLEAKRGEVRLVRERLEGVRKEKEDLKRDEEIVKTNLKEAAERFERESGRVAEGVPGGVGFEAGSKTSEFKPPAAVTAAITSSGLGAVDKKTSSREGPGSGDVRMTDVDASRKPTARFPHDLKHEFEDQDEDDDSDDDEDGVDDGDEDEDEEDDSDDDDSDDEDKPSLASQMMQGLGAGGGSGFGGLGGMPRQDADDWY